MDYVTLRKEKCIITTMEIKEINDLNTDNTATNSPDVQNYNPSDELNVGENNYDYGESLYAKNKRSGKVIKVVATTFAIGVTTLLGGTLITTSLTGETKEETKEEVSNVNLKASDVLDVSYDINNHENKQIFFVVNSGEDEVYRHDSSLSDHYNYLVNLENDIEYTAKFISIDSNNALNYLGDSFNFILRK